MSKKNLFAAIGDAARSTATPQKQTKEIQQAPIVTKANTKAKAGKRSDPDYRQTTIYVRDKLHRQFLRHLEDSGFDGDFSDWVELKMREEIKE
ncbi:hypothetical protein BCD64_00180 [Nostoc sp. MBR 210]|nr:hypothetical protein BCD64_00180 [Nostoc sp. MBR 210]